MIKVGDDNMIKVGDMVKIRPEFSKAFGDMAGEVVEINGLYNMPIVLLIDNIRYGFTVEEIEEIS